MFKTRLIIALSVIFASVMLGFGLMAEQTYFAIAQDDEQDPCSPGAIVSSYVENALSMTLDTWLETYATADCPEYVGTTVSGLKMIYDSLQVQAITSSSGNATCSPETIISTFGDAAANSSVADWVVSYENSSCPEYVRTGVNSLNLTYETLLRSSGVLSSSEIVFEGDNPIIETIDDSGVVKQWEVENIQPGGAVEIWMDGEDYYAVDQSHELLKYEYRSQACLSFEVVEYSIWATIPIENLRSATRASKDEESYWTPPYETVFANGAGPTVVAVLDSVEDARGNSMPLTSFQSIRLVSLPHEFTVRQPSDIWLLDLPSLGVSPTVSNLRFIYTADRYRSNCTGNGCWYTTTFRTSDLRFKLGNEITTMSFADIASITLEDAEPDYNYSDTSVSITLPNEYELQGILNLDVEDDMTSAYLVVDVLSEQGSYLYTLIIKAVDHFGAFPITVSRVTSEP